MCKPASFRVLPDRVLFSRVGDSHEQILEEHHIRVTDREDWSSIGVPVELSPPEMNFSVPLQRWVFALDSTINASHLPVWWSAATAERQCREALPEWWSYHHVEGGKHTCGARRTLIVSGTGAAIFVTDSSMCYTYGGGGHTITVMDGTCYTYGGGNTITVTDGVCYAYGYGHTITVQGGACFAHDDGNTITLTGGECYTYGDGHTITVQGGECHAYGGGHTITLTGGWCYADGNRNTIIDQRKNKQQE